MFSKALFCWKMCSALAVSMKGRANGFFCGRGCVCSVSQERAWALEQQCRTCRMLRGVPRRRKRELLVYSQPPTCSLFPEMCLACTATTQHMPPSSGGPATTMGLRASLELYRWLVASRRNSAIYCRGGGWPHALLGRLA